MHDNKTQPETEKQRAHRQAMFDRLTGASAPAPSEPAGPSPVVGSGGGFGVPALTCCERCGGWHGGKGQMCYKCENMKSGDRYSAYWLHPDGWFRLYPPNAEVRHDQNGEQK